MKWLVGGACAVLACVAVTGCASVPGRPTSPRVDTIQSTGSATSGNGPDETTLKAPEPRPEQPEPGTPAPQVPSPRVPPRTNGLPGAPGSPIKYDASRTAVAPAEMKVFVEEQLAELCGPDSCGVRVTTQRRGSEGCISEVSPNPVPRGGLVVIYHGPDCPGQGGEVSTGESPTAEPQPTPEDAPEPTSEAPPGTTGDGP